MTLLSMHSIMFAQLKIQVVAGLPGMLFELGSNRDRTCLVPFKSVDGRHQSGLFHLNRGASIRHKRF